MAQKTPTPRTLRRASEAEPLNSNRNRSITLTELRVLREQIAALAAQVEELADRVGGWEERQEEAETAVQKALEMIEEMGEEGASARIRAQLLDRRVQKLQKDLEAVVAVAIMVWMAKEIA